MLNIEFIALYILLGAFVGFMAGLLGVGGGGVLVPLLASIFGWQGITAENSIHLALGTALACMIISSSASMRAHTLRGNVARKLAYAMTPGILIGAFATSRIAASISSTYIAAFFAIFMALVAAQMFLNWKPKASQTQATLIGLFLVGLVIGSISSLAAVGGGFLTVTYLIYKNVDMKVAVGTSAAIGLPISLAGTIGYLISGWAKTSGDSYTFGFIYLPAFLLISVASAFAAPYGARCSSGLPEATLKRIFAILSLILSIKMLLAAS